MNPHLSTQGVKVRMSGLEASDGVGFRALNPKFKIEGFARQSRFGILGLGFPGLRKAS